MKGECKDCGADDGFHYDNCSKFQRLLKIADKMSQKIKEIKELPFVMIGDAEYVASIDDVKYVPLDDVLEILSNG